MSAVYVVDWFRIIVDITNYGYSHYKIAVALGVSAGAINGWKSGATPRHHDGEALLELWQRITEKQSGNIPRCAQYCECPKKEAAHVTINRIPRARRNTD